MKSRRAPLARQRIALLLPQSLVRVVENLAEHYDGERAATMRLLLRRGLDEALRELPAPLLDAVLAGRELPAPTPRPAPTSNAPRPVDDR